LPVCTNYWTFFIGDNDSDTPNEDKGQYVDTDGVHADEFYVVTPKSGIKKYSPEQSSDKLYNDSWSENSVVLVSPNSTSMTESCDAAYHSLTSAAYFDKKFIKKLIKNHKLLK